MGTTSNAGLPYPEGTDFVMNGDDAIQALAEELDDLVVVRLTGTSGLTAASGAGEYPVGISLLELSAAEAAAGGWPITAWPVEIMTIHSTGGGAEYGNQFIYRRLSGVPQGYYRQFHPNGSASPWAGAAAPFGSTAAIATINGTEGEITASVTVTFPAGLFTEPPAVVATASTSILNASSSGGITSTSAQLAVRRIDNAPLSDSTYPVRWIAQQDTSATTLLASRHREATAEPDATVTCPTPDCGNNGIAIPILSTWTDEDTAEVHPVTLVECGVCGTDITDTMQPIEEATDDA